MLRFGRGPHPKEWENAGDIRMTKTRHQMFLGGGEAGWLAFSHLDFRTVFLST